MSLGAVSDRAMEKAQHVKNRGWYFDLLLMENHRIKNSTPMTPTMPLIYALDLQLDRIQAEGLENRFARHASMAERIQTWAHDQGMSMVADPEYLSKTVVCIQNNLGLSISDLNKYLMDRGMRIANGYGKFKDKSFRIAPMGEIQMQDVDILLAAIDEFISR
jgi:aspartate aminotransferase-like enzyme